MANLAVDRRPCLSRGFAGTTPDVAGAAWWGLAGAGRAAVHAVTAGATLVSLVSGRIGFGRDPTFRVCCSAGPHACPLPRPARCTATMWMIPCRTSEL